MNSRRCNLRTKGTKTQSTPPGLTVDRRNDSGPADTPLGRPRAEGFLGVCARRLHLRLFTVSRFAGLLSLYILQSIH